MNINKPIDIEITLLTERLKKLITEKDLSIIPEQVFGKLIRKYLTESSHRVALKTRWEIQRILENAVTYLVIKRRISGFRTNDISVEPKTHVKYLSATYLEILHGKLPDELCEPAKVILNLSFIFTDRISPCDSEAYRLYNVLRDWIHLGLDYRKSPEIQTPKLTPETQLIRVEQIRHSLGISQVTMKKYLKECEVRIIRFSGKEQWFTLKSYQQFLNYYSVNYGKTLE